MRIDGSRDISTQGYVKSNGTVFTEGNNARLKYADNRFVLEARTNKPTRRDYRTIWSVRNRYDFESFKVSNKVSRIPLQSDMVLLLPDGLSEYMDTGLNIAHPFEYKAEWAEIWR